jgi:hypothetical protein
MSMAARIARGAVKHVRCGTAGRSSGLGEQGRHEVGTRAFDLARPLPLSGTLELHLS